MAGTMRKTRRAQGPKGFRTSNMRGPWSSRPISHAMTCLMFTLQRWWRRPYRGVEKMVRRKEKKRAFTYPSEG